MIELSLTHTRLVVDDLRACVDFYTHVLGFSETHGDVEWGYVDFYLTCGVYLALVDRKRTEIAGETGQGGPEKQVCLVFKVKDVTAMLAHLEACGVALAQPPKERWGSLVIRFHDPEGTSIEIFGPIPE